MGGCRWPYKLERELYKYYSLNRDNFDPNYKHKKQKEGKIILLIKHISSYGDQIN